MLMVRDLDSSREMLLQAAVKLVQTGKIKKRSQSLPLVETNGRILAEPISAILDVPAYTRSQVDGYAVRASDTFGCSDAVPAMLRCCGAITMGCGAGPALENGGCRSVPTGGAIPDGADAVVMIEDVDDIGDGFIYVNSPVSPGQNLIFQGDDLRAGQLLLPAGLRLQPHHLAALAAAGLAQAAVRLPLQVAVFSTGDELVPPGRTLQAGQVYDSNLTMLSALISQAGATPRSYGIVTDTPQALRTVLDQARAGCDLIVLSGGSSVGSRDHVAEAVSAAGLPGILQHGIAVKPGKPTLIGQIDHCLVLGLPGHPAAAWFMALQLLQPLLACLQGLAPPQQTTQKACLDRQVPSNHGREEFVPVRLQPSPDAADPGIATPIFAKSGLIALLRDCQGYIRIPRDCEGLPAGHIVEVILLTPPELKEVDAHAISDQYTIG